MEVINHKERCDLLRSYFQKVNPNSIPCTYKSNFEASAIQTLLNSDILHANDGLSEDIVRLSKEFGPWRMCTPNKSNEKMQVKGHHSDGAKKISKCLPTTVTRKHNYVRSMSDGSSPATRTKHAHKDTKGHKSSADDTAKVTAVPIPFPYQYSDDYKQYIEIYRRSYTLCKLQEANQARPVAARIGLRAYDFRCGMRGVNKTETPSYVSFRVREMRKPSTLVNDKNGTASRAISLKTITLQVPKVDSGFVTSSNISPLVWSSINSKSSDMKRASTRQR